jgi:antitoxin component YwqK of YwqJK toxin-antitoxin module
MTGKSCTICNSERKCNFFESCQICDCKAIHSLCWVEKLKDKETCPVCNVSFTILDPLEVYGEDLDFSYTYSYYDEVFYLKTTYDPDGNLYLDEFFEPDGKISHFIYYIRGTETPEREYFVSDKKHIDKYYTNGLLKEVIEFDSETKTNKVSIFNTKGNITNEEIFDNDYYTKKFYDENGILMSEDIRDYKINKQTQIFYNLPGLVKGATYTIEKPL